MTITWKLIPKTLASGEVRPYGPPAYLQSTGYRPGDTPISDHEDYLGKFRELFPGGSFKFKGTSIGSGRNFAFPMLVLKVEWNWGTIYQRVSHPKVPSRPGHLHYCHALKAGPRVSEELLAYTVAVACFPQLPK